MNGNGYLLDTNAIVQLLKGNKELIAVLGTADFIATSIVAEMEYLSFSGLTDADVALYQAFRGRIQVYDVPSADTAFTQLVVKARKEHGLKLPDAIIAGTAIAKGLIILTADDHFKKPKASWRTRFFAVDAGI
jgi:predicted nucleic acid-binding protein